MLSCDFWRRMQVNGNYLIGPTLVGQQAVTVTSRRQWMAVDLSYYSVDIICNPYISTILVIALIHIQIFT